MRDLVARVSALGDDPGAIDDLVADGAMSAEMARWALRTSVARFEPDALATLATRADLAGRDVAVVLARSVATAPLRAIALPLLRGARRVRVRPARGQTRFARRVCAALDVECSEPEQERGAEFVARVVREGAECVIAFGGDEALARIASELPGGIALEGRGHGLGVSVVLREALRDEAALERVARDVAHYDQFGCLSPRVVLAECDDTAPAAETLAHALAAVARELPRAPLEPALAASVNQWQGRVAARAREFFRGASHAVAAMEAPELVDSPGARNAAVVPVRSSEHAAQLLAPLATHLTCVGIAGEISRWIAPAGARARVVAAGTMQDPPWDGDGYEDPRGPTVTRR